MKKLIYVFIFLGVQVSQIQSQPRFWISPASVRSDFWEMFSPNAKWDTLLSKIDVFSIHVNALSSNRLDSNLVKNAIQKLNDASLAINFECGGLRPFSGCDSLAGERHAQTELSDLSKWITRGGKIDIITMDSPINTMIKGGDPSGTCDWNIETIANEMVDYMKTVRKRLPNVKFALVEPVPWYRVGNYPNHPGNNYGDLIQILQSVFTIIEAKGEKIEIFHSDSPYEYSNNTTTQGWLKIKAVEEWLHSKGIRHGRINNSSTGGAQDSKLFFDNTIDSYIKYQQAGGNPDEIELWSWYPFPDKNTPESEAYTFTYCCNQFFKFVNAQHDKRLLEPEDGFVYHGTQMTTFETGPDPLAGYLGALNDSTIQPAVRGFFFSIPGTRGPDLSLAGFKNFLRAADSIGFIPELSLFLVSNVATDSIIAVSNQYNWIIDSIITLSKNYGKSMFVRIGGEFNGKGPNWNGGGYKPYYYVTMFRKIVDRYNARGFRDSISTVWCYEPDAANDFDSVDARGYLWYPGDDYVDWFGLDVFDSDHFDQALPDYNRGTITKKGKSERFLSMARSKNKPVYLNETSAKGINISSDPIDGMNDWERWFAKFWQFIDVHKEIKGFNYMNANWPANAYPNWGDARIQNSIYITDNYRNEMMKSKYIHLKTNVSNPNTDTLPLTELGNGLWKNYPGGLYTNGLNERPTMHDSFGIVFANAIVPLDTSGNIDERNGNIVLLSIGMSNATQEYSVFKTMADTFQQKNPRVKIIDGAQGGQTANVIKDPNANFWRVVNQRLSQQQAHPLQVQSVWLKEANANPTAAFPKHAEDLKSDLKSIVQILKTKFPNLKSVYLSSRTYGGYATTTLNPEPYAYETGFSVKWLIEEQIKGDTALVYSGRTIKSPWLSWGPYLWAKGLTQRQDGFFWAREDFVADGTHPSNSGRLKVARLLLDFFSTDSTTVPWFLRKNITGTNDLNLTDESAIDLVENIPNPFNHQTSIKWKANKAGKTKLSIHDIFGGELYTVLTSYLPVGKHEFIFNDYKLPAGIYFYKIQLDNYSSYHRFVKTN